LGSEEPYRRGARAEAGTAAEKDGGAVSLIVTSALSRGDGYDPAFASARKRCSSGSV
jgi:hypothetical protein